MEKLGFVRVVFGLSLAAIATSGGCAQGNNTLGVGGEGASDTGEGAATSQGGGGSGGSASTGGSGGDTGTTTSGSTTSSSSSSTSTSGSGTCGGTQHECSGQCFGNTPESGCLQAVAGCPPCSAPANGSSACTAAGQCDFFCNTGYHKQGAACQCDAACCTNADCAAGETCQGGTCSTGGGGAGGGGGCDDATCQFECVAECIIMMKLGIGTCNGANCDCMCI